MKQSQENYKRIVIKIGSSLLLSDKKTLDLVFLGQIVNQIAQLVKRGIKVVVVSSGAIASGMYILKFSSRPKELAALQALAAVGQHFLMDQYRHFFTQEKLECAQILLTWEDFNARDRYLNAKNTLAKLLEFNATPIINENDTVSTGEIKFGDNDRLSALVASLISADLLVILSDVDGLFDKDKRVIRIVDAITAQVKALACPTNKKTCVGGMITKIEAAKIAVESGIPCVIANGRRRGILSSVIHQPEEHGTLFVPKTLHLAAKKRWIAFGTNPKGRIIVDDGAKNALLNKKSLLSVGIISADGDFDKGDIVSIADRQHAEFARGKAGFSMPQLNKIKGARFEREAIHRDNIVIL